MLAPEPLSAATLAYAGLNHQALDNTVLATIINAKVQDLPKIKALQSKLKQTELKQTELKQTELKQTEVKAKNGSPRTADMSFSQSLSLPGKRFILECKRASPTLGDINLGLDIPTQVELYSQRAAAISVLTEEHFFKGSYEVLEQVRALTHLPVLCKDFIICKEQIDIAAFYGANAVLLMLSVLGHELFLELYAYAKQLGLDVLTEVSTKEEAEFAASQQLDVVGINNRDLKHLTIDLMRTVELAPYFANSPKTIIVSESGITKHSAIEALAPVRCFLIGSALCASAQPNLTKRQLALHMDQVLFGLNKICGNNTPEGIEAAISNHVALSGLIFVKKSPRYISPEQAKSLIAPYKDQISFCGVFLNEELEQIKAIVESLELPFVQLHGSESVEFVQKLHQLCPQVHIIKAFNLAKANQDSKTNSNEPSNNQNLGSLQAQMNQYLQQGADYLLIDSAQPGSGQTVDLSLIPDNIDRSQILLAGGLGADNLASTKQQLQLQVQKRNEPTQSSFNAQSGFNAQSSFNAQDKRKAQITFTPSFEQQDYFLGFDLNSKLEIAPGIKDPAKINATFAV